MARDESVVCRAFEAYKTTVAVCEEEHSEVVLKVGSRK